MRRTNFSSGFSIMGILLSLVILGTLYIVLMKTYFANPDDIDKDAKKQLMEQGINLSGPSAMTKTAEDAADKASEAIKRQEKEAQAAGQ